MTHNVPGRRQPRTIVLLINTFQMGGAEGVYIQLALGLSSAGYRVIAACLQKREGQVEKALRGSKVEIVDLNVRSQFDLGALLGFISFLKKNRVDVLYTFLIQSHLVGRLAAKIAGVPVVLSSQQAMSIESKLMKWANLLTSQWCSVVVAVSRNVELYLIEDVGLPPDKIRVIYNAIPLQRFDGVVSRTHESISDPFCIGYCARLRREKDHPRLIRAVKEIKQQFPQVELLLAGDGPERATLERLVAAEGLSNTVKFLGHVDDVRQFYSRLHLYVQASYIEGLPLAILEALACGLPVVASRVAGNEEILGDGEAGVLVPPHDLEALVSAILWMITHKEEARRMGLKGRRIVEERFGSEAMVNATDRLIQSLA